MCININAYMSLLRRKGQGQGANLNTDGVNVNRKNREHKNFAVKYTKCNSHSESFFKKDS